MIDGYEKPLKTQAQHPVMRDVIPVRLKINSFFDLFVFAFVSLLDIFESYLFHFSTCDSNNWETHVSLSIDNRLITKKRSLRSCKKYYPDVHVLESIYLVVLNVMFLLIYKAKLKVL